MIAMCGLAWNGLVHSKRWLESVRNNADGHDVKLFLIDNGSMDGTYELFQSHNPEFLLRQPGNLSIYIAWNRLLREAAARNPDLIVLSNNDLVVGPGWIDAALREGRKPTFRDFLPNGNVGGNMDTFDADVRAALPELSPVAIGPARAGWFLMFKPSCLDIFLPIPEELVLWYGDDYIHTKLQEAGYVCESILDCCVKHAGSQTVFQRADFHEVIKRDREIFKRIMGWAP